ncbi:MAG: hypothetical protein JEZ00_10085 [Anaerolineaceae bacterium]|nr:hypothetical protein [Anaerolineaceae bacterium]
MKRSYLYSKHGTTLSILIFFIIALTACSLPIAAQMDEQSFMSTAVQATMQKQTADAMKSESNGSSGLMPVTLQPNTPIPTQIGKTDVPTPQAPTKQPTKKSAVSSSSSNQDKTLPTITSVNSSLSKVYYLGNTCGSSSFVLTAKVEDNSGSVNQVWVNYQIVSMSAGVGGSQWYQKNLSSSDGKNYSAQIDVSSIADTELRGNDGSLQFQVFAMDAKGNTQTEPNGFVYGVEVLTCSALGAPPAAPAGGAISISNILLYPDNKVYYGACNVEPTTLNIQATIDPLNQIQSAVIVYSYLDATGVYGTYTTNMYQLGIGDYAGDIDAGAEAGNVLNNTDGSVDFYIQVTDKNGATTDSSYMSMALEYCGNVGNNPAGNNPAGNNPAGNNPAGNNPAGNSAGGGTVVFYNNTSHPIVELVIDGVDVILSESQSIVQGGWLDVDVPDGDHTFAAGNGYWSGGQKISIYPLSGSTFNAQSGSITIGDPGIEQMLTGYYSGDYWDANVNNHCAAFNFYSSGDFDFYIDGLWNDDGRYQLVSRQPGTYSVVFRVTNSAGTEQFDGTYYYTGAMAGTMQIYNGPSGWELIEYVSGGSALCP